MEEETISFGEVPVQATTTSPQASPGEIIAIADQAWRRVNLSGVAADDEEGNDRLLGDLQSEFKDFNASFPLVLRWMAQARKYSPKAFKKYLLKHSSADLSTREAFLRLQAEYLVLLYRAERRHPSETQIKQYRDSIVNLLLEEDRRFTALQEQVEKDLAERAEAADRDRRRRLYEHLLAQKVAREAQ
jgi:hypothetical protein